MNYINSQIFFLSIISIAKFLGFGHLLGGGATKVENRQSKFF